MFSDKGATFGYGLKGKVEMEIETAMVKQVVAATDYYIGKIESYTVLSHEKSATVQRQRHDQLVFFLKKIDRTNIFKNRCI